MRWLDRIFTRRRDQPSLERVPPHVRARLRLACRQLSEAERQIQARMGLAARPRLLLIDEELAVIIPPALREALEAGADAGAP